MAEPLILDGIDRGLVHALHLDGRASFARIAAVLGTSTQTVARRYARLRTAGGLRVVGLPDPARVGRQRWIVRLTAAPGSALAVARALARRPDTAWVRLTSGGTEIVAVVHTDPDAPGDPHALLLHDVPRTAAVTAVSAHLLLHLHLGGPTGWGARAAALDPDQQARLRPAPAAAGDPAPDPADGRLLAALLHDGRTPWTELAAAAGVSAATARRRVAALRASGVLFFDVEIDDALFGVTTQALLWLSVVPARLVAVATELAAHPEQALVAATTGRTNLLANVLVPSPEALHRYLVERLALEAITAVETAPVLRTLKAAGPVGRAPGAADRPAPAYPR
jgi:DNA-binding Lrp family transcriptional regulator